MGGKVVNGWMGGSRSRDQLEGFMTNIRRGGGSLWTE